MTMKDWKHPGLFAAGVLFGTAGIKALSSKDAKKLYTNCTAAVLRAKKVVMDTVTTIQENAEDIYADAKQINEISEVLYRSETGEPVLLFANLDGMAYVSDTQVLITDNSGNTCEWYPAVDAR